jgi:hypothetical protein
MNLVTSWEQEGIEKGRLEAQRAIALNMLNHNLSPEMIAQVTGLALEQVQELQALRGRSPSQRPRGLSPVPGNEWLKRRFYG